MTKKNYEMGWPIMKIFSKNIGVAFSKKHIYSDSSTSPRDKLRHLKFIFDKNAHRNIAIVKISIKEEN